MPSACCGRSARMLRDTRHNSAPSRSCPSQPLLPWDLCSRRQFQYGVPEDRSKMNRSDKGPADNGHREHEQERCQADHTQNPAVAQQVIAGFAVEAEQNDDEEDCSPRQHYRQAGMPSDHGQKFTGGLARGYPPGNCRGNSGNQREREHLSDDPAFDLGPAAFPHQIVPGEKSSRDGYPAKQGGFMVDPQPRTKQHPGMRAGDKSGQQEPSYQLIASHGYEEGNQAHQLNPVARRGHMAPGTHRLFGQKELATTLTKHSWLSFRALIGTYWHKAY